MRGGGGEENGAECDPVKATRQAHVGKALAECAAKRELLKATGQAQIL